MFITRNKTMAISQYCTDLFRDVEVPKDKLKTQRELLKAQAVGEADILRRRGEESVQQMEMDRQATQLGMAMGEVEQAQAAIAANKQMWGNIVGGVVGAVGAAAGGGAFKKG